MFQGNYMSAIPILKVGKFDTHDRYLNFIGVDHGITEFATKLIKEDPFQGNPFYLHVHARTMDECGDRRLLWHCRLSKPAATPNSSLFKAYPGTDKIKVIWRIPDERYVDMFKQGTMFSDPDIIDYVFKYLYKKEDLEKAEPDDLPEEASKKLLLDYAIRLKKQADLKRENEEGSSTALAEQDLSPFPYAQCPPCS